MFRFRSIRSLFRRPDRRHRPSCVPRLLVLEDRTLPSTLTVLTNADSGAGSLRAVIAAAGDGDTIDFDRQLRGATITLTSGELALTKSLDIEGLGANQLAVSGNHQSRVFDISGGVTVTIAGLTITDGLAFQMGVVSQGGGIRNVASTLTVANDVFSNNEARGLGAQGQGGAIANTSGATLTITDSLFTHNQVIGVADTVGTGGAIFSNASSLTVSRCVFDHNQAFGGGSVGGGVGGGQGGAMRITMGGTALITDSTFDGNQAIGVGPGDNSEAGALDLLNGSIVTVSHCRFTDNETVAGDGSGSGSGFARAGAIYSGSTVQIEDSAFIGNRAFGGNHGSGDGIVLGAASGGAVFNSSSGVLAVSGSTFSDNQAVGGSNGSGSTSGFGSVGLALGGALSNEAWATITSSTFDHNEAIGGSGNTVGLGYELIGIGAGGAIGMADLGGVHPVLTASDLTLRHNRAVGGSDNAVGPFGGAGIGGGLAVLYGCTATVSTSTIEDNQALGGQGSGAGNGADALGGGLANVLGGILTVSGSSIRDNQALGGAGGAGGTGGIGLGAAFSTTGHPLTHPTSAPRPSSRSWIAGSRTTKPRAAPGAPAATAWAAASTSPAAATRSP